MSYFVNKDSILSISTRLFNHISNIQESLAVLHFFFCKHELWPTVLCVICECILTAITTKLYVLSSKPKAAFKFYSQLRIQNNISKICINKFVSINSSAELKTFCLLFLFSFEQLSKRVFVTNSCLLKQYRGSTNRMFVVLSNKNCRSLWGDKLLH